MRSGFNDDDDDDHDNIDDDGEGDGDSEEEEEEEALWHQHHAPGLGVLVGRASWDSVQSRHSASWAGDFLRCSGLFQKLRAMGVNGASCCRACSTAGCLACCMCAGVRHPGGTSACDWAPVPSACLHYGGLWLLQACLVQNRGGILVKKPPPHPLKIAGGGLVVFRVTSKGGQGDCAGCRVSCMVNQQGVWGSQVCRRTVGNPGWPKTCTAVEHVCIVDLLHEA